MIRSKKYPVWIALALMIVAGLTVMSAAIAAESEDAVHVVGDISKPGDWTVTRIRKDLAAEIKPVKYSLKGDDHTSNCVPLLTILKASGVSTEMKMDPNADPKTKHDQLRLSVIVTAGDGYAVMFSLAEMLSDIGNRQVWVALDQDGQPLSPRDGPVKIIVPEDAKPARWVHGVQTITVVKEQPAATQPAAK